MEPRYSLVRQYISELGRCGSLACAPSSVLKFTLFGLVPASSDGIVKAGEPVRVT